MHCRELIEATSRLMNVFCPAMLRSCSCRQRPYLRTVLSSVGVLTTAPETSSSMQVGMRGSLLA